MKPLLLLVSCFLLVTQSNAQGIFPDDIVGWRRNDSLTTFESGLKDMIGEEATLFLELGLIKLTTAHYQSNSNIIEVQFYEMHSEIEAFGIISTRCGEKNFAGFMGNAALYSDSAIELGYGNYYVMAKQIAQKKNPPPKEFMNGLYDALSPIAILALIKTPLPMDERKISSERYCGGKYSWHVLSHPAMDVILPMIENTHAFRASYVKERINVIRKMFGFVHPDAAAQDSLMRLCIDVYARAGAKQKMKKGVTEILYKDSRVYLYTSRTGLKIVIAEMNDPWTIDWLIEEAKK